MKLNSIRIKGIATLKDVYLDFEELGDGLLAVCGENGSGKTTLLECIGYALIGKLPSKDINIYELCSESDAVIELDYNIETNNYRHLIKINSLDKKMEGLIYVNNEVVNDGKITTYREYCEKHITTVETWLASVFCSQNNSRSFIDLPVKDRKALFIDMLGLNKLEDISQKAAEYKTQYQNELKAIELSEGYLDLNGLELDDLVTERQKKETDKVKTEAEIKGLEEQRTELEKKYYEVLEAKNKKVSEVAELKDRRIKAERAIARSDDLSRELRINNLVIDESKTNLDALTKEHVLKTEELEYLDTNISYYQNEIMGLTAKINNETQGYRQEIEDERSKSEKELKLLTDELKSYTDLITPAKRECYRLEVDAEALGIGFTKDLSTAEKEYVKDSRLIAEQIYDLKAQAKTLDSLPCTNKFSSEYDGCELKQKFLKAYNQIPELETKLTHLKDNYDKVVGYKTEEYKDREEAKNKALAEAKEYLKSFDTKVSEVNNKIEKAQNSFKDKAKTLNGLITDINLRHKTDMEEYNSNLDTAKSDKAKAGTEVKALANRCSSSKKDLDRLESETKSIAIELENLSKLIPEDGVNALIEAYNQTAKELDELITKQQDITRKGKDVKDDIHYQGLKVSQWTIEMAIIDNNIKAIEAQDLKRKEIEVQKAQCQKLLNAYNYLAITFGRNGIQALEIDAAGPAISELSTSLLEECFGNRFNIEFITVKQKAKKKEYKEVFDIIVHDTKNNHSGDIKEFSGGEKAILSIAIQLALSLYKAGINTRFKTLFFDEITSSLSEDNGHKCVTMLGKARVIGDFNNIIFSTHNSGAAALADNCIRIEELQPKGD
jgi:exonuclease SbcC